MTIRVMDLSQTHHGAVIRVAYPTLVPWTGRVRSVTKYPLVRMVRFALDAITGFSYVPLQLATTLGFLLAGLSLLGILIAAALRL